MTTRLPAVAGTFYPADRDALLDELGRDFAGARPAPDGRRPKAIIAPHAGYLFSGPVAATAFSWVRSRRGAVERVVLLGPSHRVPFRGLAMPSADRLATPLGDVRVDVARRDAVKGMPGVAVWDAPHLREHSLEVHFPFILEVLGDVVVLPVVVGDAPAEQVAAVLDAVWGGDETLIVVSSDLSHYHPYEEAVALDRLTAAAIEEGRAEDIGPYDACGVFPVRGLLVAARTRGLRCRIVDLRNSGDTAGTRDRVVGYGAFVFEAEADRVLGPAEREALLDLADGAVRAGLGGGRPRTPAAAAPVLQDQVGVFVTLTVDGDLNGCIGNAWPAEPLCEAVPRLAWEAAFADPRLPALRREQYPALDIEISVLSPPVPVPAASEDELLARVRPCVDGLILVAGARRATFLPSVWDKLPEAGEFVAQLKAKAGIRRGEWPPDLAVYRYTASTFGRHARI